MLIGNVFHQNGLGRPSGCRFAHQRCDDGRDSNNGPQRWVLRQHGLQGGAENRQQTRGFNAPAARHNDQRAIGCGQPMAGAETRGIALIHAAFQHGMAHEGNGYVSRFKKRRLERQQAEQMVNLAPQVFNAPRAPRPDLRCDIMQHANAARLYGFRYPQRETGAVNRHQQGRLAGEDISFCFSKAPLQLPNARQHFQQAHQRQFAIGEKAGHALFGHAFAANAGEAQLRPRLA